MTKQQAEMDTAVLTRREIEVLTQLQSGSENQTIATTLSLSVKTVEMHLTSIYAKLRVKNRTQAVLWLVKATFVREDILHQP